MAGSYFGEGAQLVPSILEAQSQGAARERKDFADSQKEMQLLLNTVKQQMLAPAQMFSEEAKLLRSGGTFGRPTQEVGSMLQTPQEEAAAFKDMFDKMDKEDQDKVKKFNDDEMRQLLKSLKSQKSSRISFEDFNNRAPANYNPSDLNMAPEAMRVREALGEEIPMVEDPGYIEPLIIPEDTREADFQKFEAELLQDPEGPFESINDITDSALNQGRIGPMDLIGQAVKESPGAVGKLLLGGENSEGKSFPGAIAAPAAVGAGLYGLANKGVDWLKEATTPDIPTPRITAADMAFAQNRPARTPGEFFEKYPSSLSDTEENLYKAMLQQTGQTQRKGLSEYGDTLQMLNQRTKNESDTTLGIIRGYIEDTKAKKKSSAATSLRDKIHLKTIDQVGRTIKRMKALNPETNPTVRKELVDEYNGVKSQGFNDQTLKLYKTFERAFKKEGVPPPPGYKESTPKLPQLKTNKPQAKASTPGEKRYIRTSNGMIIEVTE